jgi:tetratricopeptide (TPR) repeat protein
LSVGLALCVAPARAQSDADALLSRALVLHQSGELEGAAALYVQLLRAYPGAGRLRSNLGAAYAGLGRYEEAIEQYRKALEQELPPEEGASVRRNLALALQKSGRTLEAAEEARGLLASAPGNRDALLLLADCHLRLGDAQAAAQLLAPAASADPNDKALAYVLGTALLELGRADEAQAVMERVFRDDSPEGSVLLGLMYSKKQDWAKALVELAKARAARPSPPLANFLYGQALLKSVEQSRIVQPVDWEAAADAFRAELTFDPGHFESNLLLGSLLREEGRHEQAIGHLVRAARVRPADLAVQFSLGAAYVAAGRLEEARSLLEPVARAAPSHLPTQIQLAVLYSRLGEKDRAAAARAAAVRLQKEADARSFEGAGQVVRDLLGRTAASPGAPEAP